MIDAAPRPTRRALATGLAVVTTALALSTVWSAPAIGQAAGPTTTEPASTTTTTSPPSSSTDPTTTDTSAAAPATTVAAAPGGTTTTSTSTPTAATTTTTLPQIPEGPVPASPPAPTTVPAPAATVPPAQVQSLLQGLQAEVAQFDAMDAYGRDHVVAVNAGTQVAAADAVVTEAQQDLATVTEKRDMAVQTVGSNIRHLSGLAIALYLDEGAASLDIARSLDASTEDRQVMLSILLEGGQRKVKTSRQDASNAGDDVRAAADRLAQARQGQAVARQSEDRAAAVLAADKAAALGLPPPKAAPGTPAARRGSKPAATPAAPAAPASPTVEGPSLLGAAELAGWFASTGHAANVTVPMAELAADYIDAGHTEGVRADVAFAQSVIETGYFGFPAGGELAGTDNNFAGIGACDSCTHGWGFPDARTGVAAQLQLLNAYASTTPVAAPLIGKVFVAGCCRTWMALTGVWASAPTYGFEVLSLYRQLVDWALPRRLAIAGLAPPVPTR